MQRIGVFVCWCGSNIAATVDVEKVSQVLAQEPGVVFSTNYQYMCSQAGQELIQESIKNYNLTGVVICSCSPRMHETTFRKACEKAGLNVQEVVSYKDAFVGFMAGKSKLAMDATPVSSGNEECFKDIRV